MDDGYLHDLMSRLDPRARGAARRVLIADQRYRDALAERLLRERTDHATNLANLIDMLTIDPDAGLSGGSATRGAGSGPLKAISVAHREPLSSMA